METKVTDEKGNAASWLTADKLEELGPTIEADAQEHADRKVAAWTPEFREALRKLRER